MPAKKSCNCGSKKSTKKKQSGGIFIPTPGGGIGWYERQYKDYVNKLSPEERQQEQQRQQRRTQLRQQRGGVNPLLIGAVAPVANAVGDVTKALAERGSVASNNILKKGQLTGKYERIKDKKNLKTYKQYIKAGIPPQEAMRLAFD